MSSSKFDGPGARSCFYELCHIFSHQIAVKRGFKDLDTCILKYETITVISKIDSSKKTQKYM